MVIASTQIEGGTLLVLGLSRGNRERLEEGHPIRITQETHGMVVPPGLKILIFAGETEASMEQELASLVSLKALPFGQGKKP